MRPGCSGKLTFPPYDFDFSVQLDERGRVSCTDSLATEKVLVWQRHTLEGEPIAYEAEAHAAAWAFVLNTPRRVINRPGWDQPFAASAFFDLSEMLERHGALLLPLSVGARRLRLVASGFLTAAGFLGTDLHDDVATELNGVVEAIGSLFDDNFIFAEIHVDEENLFIRLQSEIPAPVFLTFRDVICRIYQ